MSREEAQGCLQESKRHVCRLLTHRSPLATQPAHVICFPCTITPLLLVRLAQICREATHQRITSPHIHMHSTQRHATLFWVSTSPQDTEHEMATHTGTARDRQTRAHRQSDKHTQRTPHNKPCHPNPSGSPNGLRHGTQTHRVGNFRLGGMWVGAGPGRAGPRTNNPVVRLQGHRVHLGRCACQWPVPLCAVIPLMVMPSPRP